MTSARLARWLTRLEQLDPSRIELGLERTREVFGRLAIARANFTMIIAGTNGKGSVSHYADALLQMGGDRVGRYTSPHLVAFNERICIDGKTVEDGMLADAFDSVDRARGDVALTYFEFTTLAAFSCFDRSDCDAWVLEVGLGGRLDAVNIVEPDVAVLTNVGLDHQRWLGESREKIGFEKAHVFRRDKPAVLGSEDLPETVLSVASETGASVIFAPSSVAEDGAGWRWDFAGRSVPGLPLTMPEHQQHNYAATLCALAAVERLRVDDDTIRAVAATVMAPARQQRMTIGSRDYLLDVAHNIESVRVLTHALVREKTAITLVFGVMQDKPVDEMIALLAPHVSRWICVAAPTSRACDAVTLARRVSAITEKPVLAAGSPVAGIRAAGRLAGAGDLVVVAGSFPVVAAAAGTV